ncbi:MAG: P1 family peptidase [Anaerolineaceae bacterium]|nr:P1 family peptidase [Anaerolineaceae bacterium]
MTRARDLGIPFEGKTGKWNAITDVANVEVGHKTLISGEGKLVRGKGPIRTGVTAILPRGKNPDPVFAGWYSLNGNGEMTGTTWVEESGFLEGPVMITNTHSVGVVRDAVVNWMLRYQDSDQSNGTFRFFLPVVAETYDGGLNDINGFHVKSEHALNALDEAKNGPVAEGNVGGGTGMVCHDFKGGIGTSSRVLEIGKKTYTLGVLVQANYGDRNLLTIAGVPVGLEIPDLMPEVITPDTTQISKSIIVVIATDAPLLPHHCKRLARRVPLGISKVGGIGDNASGDIFIAFSTANPNAANPAGAENLKMVSNVNMTKLFAATIQATEEAIINALIAAKTMTGINGKTIHALPHERLQPILSKYNRWK